MRARALVVSSAGFWVGVALSVGKFNVPQPVATAILLAGLFGYIYVFLTWRPVYRKISRARKDRPVSSILAGSVVGAILFAIGVWLFRPAIQPEPSIGTDFSKADYPPNTTLSGIPWSNRFSQLKLVVVNESTSPIDDFEMTVKPDVPIAEIAQSSDLPDVRIFTKADMSLRQELVMNGAATTFANPLVLIATNMGYVVQCKRLPSTRRLEIVMALVTVNDTPKPGAIPGSQRPDFGIFTRDYVLKVAIKDVANWYGRGRDDRGRIEEVFGAKPKPSKLTVEAKYKIDDDDHQLTREVPILDPINTVMQQRAK